MKTGGVGSATFVQPLSTPEVKDAAGPAQARPAATVAKAPVMPNVASDFQAGQAPRGATIAPPAMPSSSPRKPMSDYAKAADQFGNKNGRLDEPDLAVMREDLQRYDERVARNDPSLVDFDHFSARMHRQALPHLEEELKELQAQAGPAKPLAVPTAKPEESIPVAGLQGEQAEAAERADRLFGVGPGKDKDLTLEEARAYAARLDQMAVDQPQHAAKANAQLAALKPLIERLERGEENAALQYIDQRARAGGTQAQGWLDGKPVATGGKADGKVDEGEVTRLREEMVSRAKADPANAHKWNTLISVADRLLRRMTQE